MQNLDLSQESSLLGKWFSEWWNAIDKSLLAAYGALVVIGVILIGTASPPVADRIGIGTYSFLQKHLILIFPGLLIALAISALNLRMLRLFALALLAGSLAALVLTLLIGVEIKGAQRWLSIGGFSLQPSEFVKPAFAFVCAWLFSTQRNDQTFPESLLGKNGGYKAGFVLTFIIIALLLKQPDWGQSLLIITTFFSLLLMIGISLFWCAGFIFGGGVLLLVGYQLVPHVRSRLDSYFSDGANYQVEKSLQAFGSGGFGGRGPAEGSVKNHLPDSHTDFIFAVAAEEFGFVVCALLLCLFIYIFGRIIWRVSKQNNHFIILASVALTVQLAAQAFINIASSLSLTPTTGMTLPLISYGGSSLLAVNIGFGLLLNLTRKHISYSN